MAFRFLSRSKTFGITSAGAISLASYQWLPFNNAKPVLADANRNSNIPNATNNIAQNQGVQTSAITFDPRIDHIGDATSNYDRNTNDYGRNIAECSDFVALEREIQGFPGCSVTVMKDHKVIFERGFGYSDVENGILCTPQTVLRIASISKSLTSAVVGILVESGKLSLDDTVQTYLKDFPLLPVKQQSDENDKRPRAPYGLESSRKKYSVTVGQCCSHTSGIRHYNNPKDKNNTDEYEWLSRKHYNDDNNDQIYGILQTFMNDELLFEPGKGYNYSTYNYSVVGAVVQSILANENETNNNNNDNTNNGYVAFMKERILQPLNMHNTHADSSTRVILNRGKQYTRGNNGYLNNDEKSERHRVGDAKVKHELCNPVFVDLSNKYAGGGFLSTSNDIAKFGDGFILQNKIISKETLYDSLLQEKTMKKSNYYGMGWIVSRDKETNEIIEVGHSGGAIGCTSHLLVRPNENLVVSIIINMEGTNPLYIARKIADYFKE